MTSTICFFLFLPGRQREKNVRTKTLLDCIERKKSHDFPSEDFSFPFCLFLTIDIDKNSPKIYFPNPRSVFMVPSALLWRRRRGRAGGRGADVEVDVTGGRLAPNSSSLRQVLVQLPRDLVRGPSGTKKGNVAFAFYKCSATIISPQIPMCF